jgi:hypothetical protein
MEIGDFNSGSSQGFRAGVVFAEELLSGSNGYAKGPVRSLMSALLFDGVQAFLDCALSDPTCRKARTTEAYSWVMRRGTEYIFAFDSVCEALGLDAEYVRLGLSNACQAYQSDCQGDWKRSRRNF